MVTKYWKIMGVIAAALVAFLGGYEVFRNKGKLITCDMLSLVGQKELLSICAEDPALMDNTDKLALLNYLEANKTDLNKAEQEEFQRLKQSFLGEALETLSNEADRKKIPVDPQAESAATEALVEIIEQGDAEERRALGLIARGDLAAGLALLTQAATEAAIENAAQWRHIGRLSYGVDTKQALAAYEKVVALDQSDVWDSIYLGRLYERTGSLAAAHSNYKAALARLPEADERNRAVLFSEIGDVLKAQGDLSAALASYRDALAIGERLAQADPDNAGWQRDLSVSHERIGDIEAAGGNIAAAIVAYEKSLPIAQSLADRFPEHPRFQADIVITKRRIRELRAQLTQ